MSAEVGKYSLYRKGTENWVCEAVDYATIGRKYAQDIAGVDFPQQTIIIGSRYLYFLRIGGQSLTEDIEVIRLELGEGFTIEDYILLLRQNNAGWSDDLSVILPNPSSWNSWQDMSGDNYLNTYSDDFRLFRASSAGLPTIDYYVCILPSTTVPPAFRKEIGQMEINLPDRLD